MHVFRNEKVTGSNPVSSPRCPGKECETLSLSQKAYVHRRLSDRSLITPLTLVLEQRACSPNHAMIDRCQVSRGLTSLVPQTRHKTSILPLNAWSQGFDRIFRNEEVTGSNPVSSTNAHLLTPVLGAPRLMCFPIDEQSEEHLS